MSGTPISDHLSFDEIARLSDQSRALLQSVSILFSRDTNPEDVHSLHSPSTSSNTSMVGFQCIHCASSPLVSAPNQVNKPFDKVFPGSIETIGASLGLLHDKHFSLEAAQHNQRCMFLPFSLQNVFDRPDAQPNQKELQQCCDAIARKLEMSNKSSNAHSKTGIVVYKSMRPGGIDEGETNEHHTNQAQGSPYGNRHRMAASTPRGYASYSYSVATPIHVGYGEDHPGTFVKREDCSFVAAEVLARRHSPHSGPGTGPHALMSPMATNSSASGRGGGMPPLPSVPGNYNMYPNFGGPGGGYGHSPHERYHGMMTPVQKAISVKTDGGYVGPDPSAVPFVQDGLGYSCPYCVSVPFHHRAPGCFFREAPTQAMMATHYNICTGLSGQRHLAYPGSGGGYPHLYGRPPVGVGDYIGTVTPADHGIAASAKQLSSPSFRAKRSEMQKKRAEAAVQARNILQGQGLPSEPPMDDALVKPEDKLLLTDYFYYLNQQLRICRFTESDRKTRGGKRKNILLGFGGIECRHCHGEHGARKFFWNDVDRLANSFSEIPAHVMKCGYCPEEVKMALAELKSRHSGQMSKLPRGWQKVFFRRMWRRMHGSEDGEDEDEDTMGVSNDKTISPKRSESGNDEPASSGDPDEGGSSVEITPSSSRGAYLLSIPEDKQWLSDMDCFIRTCLEVFISDGTESGVKGGTKVSSSKGQVGIRCIYCASSDVGASGEAISYPLNINGIYETVREFQRVHFTKCPNIPTKEKNKLDKLKTSSSLSSVLRRYYVIAAKALKLGMYDAEDGIRAKSNDKEAERNSVPKASPISESHGISIEDAEDLRKQQLEEARVKRDRDEDSFGNGKRVRVSEFGQSS